MRKVAIILSAFLCLMCTNAPAQINQSPKVPTKLTFAGETVKLNTPDRIEKMDRELMSFTYMHSNSQLILKRSKRFFSIVEPILRKEGVPDDMKYLMCIESNLDPKAVSPAGAAGVWQFTKSTAKEYGLEIRDGVDERYNIEKETVAACKFFKKAYEKYGNWMTVAASYNLGQNGMTRRIEEQRQDNAMNLWLPEETTRYMFRLMACKMLFSNPSSFGFEIGEDEYYPYLPPREYVIVTTPIASLVDFAVEHEVSYAELKAANMWLRDIKLDNKDGKTYKICIPSSGK